MDATYTTNDIATLAAGLKIAIKEQLTVGQRIELGRFDADALSEEFLVFLSKSYFTMEEVEAALARTSKQLQKLVEFGVLKLTAS